jgi:hypothetical protein
MIKKVAITLILALTLSLAAAAQDPGVFLPFYFVYDDVVVHDGGLSVNNHTAVFFQNHPMVSVTSDIDTAQTYPFIMNIMRARYFSKFNVNPGDVFNIGVAIGADNYGLDPILYNMTGDGFDKVDLTLYNGQGQGLLPPDGTVPIDIGTGSPDVKITWDPVAYPHVDVYRMEGDGTGQYDKNYSVRWQLVSDDDQDGEYVDSNYIADGPFEAYYKALEDGRDPNVYIPLAWGVGKYDLDLISGYNLASTPLIPLHGNSIDETFLDQSGGGLRTQDTEVYYFNESAGLTIKAQFDNGTWKYFPNTPYSIDLGHAYWVKIPSGTKRLSVMGAVIVSNNHRILGASGFSLMSSPLPVYYPDLAAAGLPSLGTDEIFLFHANTGVMEKMMNKTGAWGNAVPGEPAFGLNPGVGYWYKNNDIDRDWTLSP